MAAAYYAGVDITGVPELDLSELLTVLGGMLGLGGLRTYEKKLGVHSDSLKHNNNGNE